MGILNFLREYIDIRRESKSYCKSCETLREQLNVANHEKRQLLDRFVLIQPAAAPMVAEKPTPIAPKVVPWKIQREMLEAEDRAKATTLRKQAEEAERARYEAIKNTEGPIETKGISVEELEKELAIQSEVN